MPKQEKFVVIMCGCHRGLHMNINMIADSRVDAIRVAENIGQISAIHGQRENVRKFLEGEEIKDSLYLFYHYGLSHEHFAAILPITDR